MNTAEKLVAALNDYLAPHLRNRETQQSRVLPVQALQMGESPVNPNLYPYIVYERTGDEGTASFGSVHAWGERFTVSVLHSRYSDAYSLANGIGAFLKERGLLISATFDTDDFDPDIEAYECGVSVVLHRSPG